MSNIRKVVVGDRGQFRTAMNSYAAQGFTVLHSDQDTASMSRKKPFNWLLAIICLFIPVIGWIALGYMLFAANRGSEVVEITLDEAAAALREVPRTLRDGSQRAQ